MINPDPLHNLINQLAVMEEHIALVQGLYLTYIKETDHRKQGIESELAERRAEAAKIRAIIKTMKENGL